jgi:hypothetical protein
MATPNLISLTWNGKEKKRAALLSAHSKETNLNLKRKGSVQEPICHLATGYNAKDGTEQTEIQNRYRFSLRPQRNRDGTCKKKPSGSLKGDGFFNLENREFSKIDIQFAYSNGKENEKTLSSGEKTRTNGKKGIEIWAMTAEAPCPRRAGMGRAS